MRALEDVEDITPFIYNLGRTKNKHSQTAKFTVMQQQDQLYKAWLRKRSGPGTGQVVAAEQGLTKDYLYGVLRKAGLKFGKRAVTQVFTPKERKAMAAQANAKKQAEKDTAVLVSIREGTQARKAWMNITNAIGGF